MVPLVNREGDKMPIIENNKELKLENVLSLRKKMGQADVPQEMMKIGEFLKRNDIKKNGPIVTATFNIEKTNEEPILDMEILVPMDRQVELSGEDRKSTRLNSSHVRISYAVFCLKKKTK